MKNTLQVADTCSLYSTTNGKLKLLLCWRYNPTRGAMLPPCVHLDVPQVLLNCPQSTGTGLQLGHLRSVQGHVNHTGHAPVVQHTRQTQIHLVSDAIHSLLINNNSLEREQPTTHRGCVCECLILTLTMVETG